MLALTQRYPTQLIDRWTLADGRRVTLRPVLPQDAELEQALVRGLSSESRYHRWFAPIRELSPQSLEALTRVDYRHHLALVVESFDGGVARAVAEAQYVVDAGAGRCDFGLVVADAWRRRGIATRLLDVLEGQARDDGIGQFEGDVIATNDAMIALLRRRGFVLRRNPDDARLMQAALALQPARATAAVP